VRAARPRRVSVALRARARVVRTVLGAAHRAFDTTRSVLSRVTCSSTPVSFMRIDHVIYINEMETQLRN
jgi:hypothetical protein